MSIKAIRLIPNHTDSECIFFIDPATCDDGEMHFYRLRVIAWRCDVLERVDAKHDDERYTTYVVPITCEGEVTHAGGEWAIQERLADGRLTWIVPECFQTESWDDVLRYIRDQFAQRR